MAETFCFAHNIQVVMGMHQEDNSLVDQVLVLLDGGQAHASLDDAVADFPAALRGVVPERLPYSAWQLVEHLRIAQHDILEFSDPPATGYQHKKWPEAYWPKSPEAPSESAWDESVAAIVADRERFKELLQRPNMDLFKTFPWGDGQNLLREALLIADHNAYHTGELVVLRRLLGCWE